MLRDIARALAQLGDRGFRTVLWRGVALAAGLLAGLWLLVTAMAAAFLPDSMQLPLLGEVGGLAGIVSVAAALAMLVASIFLMVPVAAMFASLFGDRIAASVEARHYPGLPPARALPLWQEIGEGLGLALVLLGVNLLGLAGILLAGPVAPLILWGVNGYLLGREFFVQAAMRRLGRPAALALFRAHRGQIWAMGVIMAAPLALPLVNLFLPVIGMAAFTHTLHRLGSGRISSGSAPAYRDH